MREWQSQSHVRWYCRYHVVWVPKYRKRAIFGEMRRGVGSIVRELCQRHGVELVEGHALSDHVHVLLGIPPKLSVANTVGFLKAKSAIRIHRAEGDPPPVPSGEHRIAVHVAGPHPGDPTHRRTRHARYPCDGRHGHADTERRGRHAPRRAQRLAVNDRPDAGRARSRARRRAGR